MTKRINPETIAIREIGLAEGERQERLSGQPGSSFPKFATRRDWDSEAPSCSWD